MSGNLLMKFSRLPLLSMGLRPVKMLLSVGAVLSYRGGYNHLVYEFCSLMKQAIRVLEGG